MEHEKAHVRQLHTVDLLFTEILVVLFWFNPFVFLLRNAVRANHEFLADAAVLNCGTDKLEYLQILAVQATSHQFDGFGSHFKSSTLKNRIIMITKKKSSLIRSLKYLLALPLLAILLYAFSIKELEKNSPLQKTKSTVSKTYLKSGTVFTLDKSDNYKLKEVKGTIKNGEHSIIEANEAEVGNITFKGGKLKIDSRNRTLTVLGDSCYMEVSEQQISPTISFESETNPKFLFPFKDKKSVKRTSGFGQRIHPIFKKKIQHNGIDFSAQKGTPILAIAAGTIRTLENVQKSYGKYIIIDHPDGFSSLYAQMSDYNTKEGDQVKQGDVIGFVGNSGMATGPHLHLELKKNGEYVNPANFIEGFKSNE